MGLESSLISAYGAKIKPKKMVIAGHFDPEAVAAVEQASARGWVEPVFCGGSFSGRTKGMDHMCLSLDVPEAKDRAAGMAASGEAEAIMITGPLDREILNLLGRPDSKYKSARILSYISVFLAPRDGRLTLLTDPLFNATPCLKDKIAIIENGIEAAASLGIQAPLIAAVAPLELVNPDMPSTLDAAIISKMSQRGQFGEAVIEGPLGMDNAESASAAGVKNIVSPVPGHVDIYFFPDLESASITAQFISYLGPCEMGGLVAGSDFPVILRSSLETGNSWLTNILLGVL